jgi:formylglycine-generating enzyme required for sulfatase activity
MTRAWREAQTYATRFWGILLAAGCTHKPLSHVTPSSTPSGPSAPRSSVGANDGPGEVRLNAPPPGVPSASTPTPPAGPEHCPEGTAFLAGGPFRRIAPEYKTPWPRYAHDEPVAPLAPFCLDKTEVTVGAYAGCVQAGGCTRPGAPSLWEYGKVIPGKVDRFCNALDRPDRARHPVNCVDWEQAAAYCRWAGGSLPTSDQWLYAAQGGALARRYPWGSTPLGFGVANLCGLECTKPHRVPSLDDTIELIQPAYHKNDGWLSTAPVGTFPKGATPEGVYDLIGNVEEWTKTERDVGNTSTGAKSCYVAGGHWLDTTGGGFEDVATSAGSLYDRVATRSSLRGFRCVKHVVAAEQVPDRLTKTASQSRFGVAHR